MPRKYDVDRKRPGRARDRQRAAWIAQGLTSRGTPRKICRDGHVPARHPHRLTSAHLDALAHERERRAHDLATATERLAKKQTAHESDPRTVCYREEKTRGEQRRAAQLAEAKACFDRLYDDLRAAGKGGRPRKNISVHRDPANALVEALEGRSRPGGTL